GPESDCGQMITVNRSADHFRDHVIGGAESERTEPKEKEIVRVPPIDRRLQHTLHRNDKKHGLGGQIHPREPEKSGEEIPLRDVNRIAATKPEHQHRPRSDERVSQEKCNGDVAGKFEPMITSAIARQNSADTKPHTKVPKSAAGNEQ